MPVDSRFREPIVRYGASLPSDDTEGDIDALAMWAGQGVAQVRRVQPAADIVAEIDAEASAILRRLGALAG